MTRKERDNRKTDRAWENVYQRLEKDGLLDHKEKNSIIPYGDMRRPPLWKIISATAAMLVFCIYLSTIYFNQTNKETDRNLLTRQNMETTTLATTLEDGSIVYLAGNAAIPLSVKTVEAEMTKALQTLRKEIENYTQTV